MSKGFHLSLEAVFSLVFLALVFSSVSIPKQDSFSDLLVLQNIDDLFKVWNMEKDFSKKNLEKDLFFVFPSQGFDLSINNQLIISNPKDSSKAISSKAFLYSEELELKEFSLTVFYD